MGRRKKTLHDYAAEFSELAVKRQRPERGGGGGGGEAAESLWCSSCQLPLRVRRDRILEHLASGRHYRNRRLARQRAPLLLSAGPDLSLPLQLDAPSLLTQPPLVLAATTAGGPSLLPSAIGSTTAPDQAPSTSAFTALRVRIAPAPAERSSRSPAVPQARDGAVLGRCSAGGLGLALFGTELGDNALFQSLVEENGCCLLYVVEDRLHEVERAFSAEFLAGTRVLRQQDADIVLNDQRYQPLLK